jgi:hypothetical protein
MTDDKVQPDPADGSERAVPEQSSQQTQQGQADVPSPAAQPGARRRDAGRSFAAKGFSLLVPRVCLQAAQTSGRAA